MNGYKTFIIAFAGVIYGLYVGNMSIVISSLGMIGLRQAVSQL